MNIVFFGIYSNEKFINQVVNKTKSPFSIAQYKMEKALINGFIENGLSISKAYCMPSLPYSKITKKLYTKSFDVSSDSINVSTLPILNIPVLGNIFLSLNLFIRLLFTNKKKMGSNPVFFITLNYLPVAIPLIIISKIKRIKTIIMLTDCARNTFELRSSIEAKKFKKIIYSAKRIIAEYFERRYYAYIFLTNHMNDIINVKNRPFTIIEGIYESSYKGSHVEKIIETERISEEKNIILYSGSLFKIYGIDKIIDVMKYVDDDIEVHIYGDGEYKENVLQAQENDSRIKYCGFVDQETLKSKMRNAKLLINLRNPSLEFTKLSFPSKIFDYMVSGSPVLTTKLQGIPEEYYLYMYYTSSYDSQEIGKKINEICKFNKYERNILASNARDFILNDKNEIIQTKKIISFLEGIGT